jgi:hypothetical protein
MPKIHRIFLGALHTRHLGFRSGLLGLPGEIAAAECDEDGTRAPKAENVDGEVPQYLWASVQWAAIA